MKKVLMTHMSSKGQVVIPYEFRKILGFLPGTPLAVFIDGANIVFKSVDIPKAEDLEDLLRDSRRATKKAGLTKADLSRAIKKVRREYRA